MVVAARGTGEFPSDWSNPAAYNKGDDYGAGATLYDLYFNHLVPSRPDLEFSLEPVMYPVPNIKDLRTLANFESDASTGGNTIVADIHQTDVTCGHTVRYVLAGYSLGAWAVHDALSHLSAAQLAEIAGVALFGDPKFLPGQAIVRDFKSQDTNDGMAVGVDKRANGVPPAVVQRTGSWCFPDDPVCQVLPDTATWLEELKWCTFGPASLCAHFQYANQETREAAAFLGPFLPKASSTAGDWAMAGHDPAQTYNDPTETTINASNVSRLTKKWTNPDGWSSLTSDGTVYSIGGGLNARSVSDGKLLWTHPFGSDVSSLVAIGDGLVIYWAYNSTALAADSLSNGTLQWIISPDIDPHTQPPSVVLDGGTIIFATNSGLEAIDASTGKEIWATTTGGNSYDTFAVGEGIVAALVYKIPGSVSLITLNESTGKQEYSVPLGSYSSPGSIAISGSQIICWSGNNFRLQARDLPTGSLIWKTPDLDFFLQLSVSGNSVYAIGDDNFVYAFTNGQEIWKRSIANGLATDISSADGVVYLSDEDSASSSNQAFDAATGAVLWTTSPSLGFAYPAGGQLIVGPDIYGLP